MRKKEASRAPSGYRSAYLDLYDKVKTDTS